MRSRLAIVCLLAVAPLAAQAQAPSEQVKAVAGAYQLSNTERDKVCNVTLKTDPARGGYKVEFEKPCPEAIPPTKDVEAWALVNDAVRLIDARGRVLFDFTEVESGMFEAERRGEGLYFLQNAAAPELAVKSVEQMTGEWNMRRRAGPPICSITLENAPAGDEGLRLRIRPGCDAVVARFNPVSWKMDLGQLVLTSRGGDTWRFEQDDENADLWRRLSDSAEGVTMAKR
jgi:hypothetical protein